MEFTEEELEDMWEVLSYYVEEVDDFVEEVDVEKRTTLTRIERLMQRFHNHFRAKARG